MQGTNTTVSAIVGDTIVLAANAARKFGQVVNVSGSTVFISLGAVGLATNIPLVNNGTWTIPFDTRSGINQQAVHIFNNTAGPLNIQVYEE